MPFGNATFDVIIFGFCLYLCDQQDLFRVAQEADRVLKPDSWLVINDFYAPNLVKRAYHHKVTVHGKQEFTDDPQEWVATSIMRKKSDNQ